MNNTVTATVAAAIVVASATKIIKTTAVERKKRAAIKASNEKQIAAIRFALGYILEEIHAGRYDGKTLSDVLVDQEFAKIAYLNK